MKQLDKHTAFGGSQEVWKHRSEATGCDMRFGIFLPEKAADEPCPVLYFLSGLTCTEQNFITKAGFQRFAAKHGIIVVAPDTSPRGEDVPDDDAYDLGKGAGFYLNATQSPWDKHYHMYDYVVDELPSLVESHFPVTKARSVFGHSMGGHGALICALKNPGLYQSVSAFSPVVAPTRVPWGEKAFKAYLGDDREEWNKWDACELVPDAEERLELFIDQGHDDQFFKEQLQPHRIEEVCEQHGHPLTLRIHEGYDHSYYFIATFIEDHFRHHAKALR